MYSSSPGEKHAKCWSHAGGSCCSWEARVDAGSGTRPWSNRCSESNVTTILGHPDQRMRKTQASRWLRTYVPVRLRTKDRTVWDQITLLFLEVNDGWRDNVLTQVIRAFGNLEVAEHTTGCRLRMPSQVSVGVVLTRGLNAIILEWVSCLCFSL